jgi:cupin 2 domain-containing protein
MCCTLNNLLASLPESAETEQFVELLRRPGLRIERIVSTGQTSPPGFWYDQDWSEWVLLLAGAAELLLEGEAQPRRLEAGSFIDIPAHRRHRVEWTSTSPAAVWLAIHYQG